MTPELTTAFEKMQGDFKKNMIKDLTDEVERLRDIICELNTYRSESLLSDNGHQAVAPFTYVPRTLLKKIDKETLIRMSDNQ